MIPFEKFVLKNGLRVIVHRDNTTPMVAMNILYNVGARDENPEQTGFAHLFEHLMFGGSVNIPKYDTPLENAGGENNAFTNNDLTNYYLTIPKQNLELAFWLESDRMLNLAFSKKSLEVQRSVVCEEFRQSYLNQPYGDAWLLMRPLAYKVHPYRWPTIGKEIAHIENAKMQDVKKFYQRFYNPNNAILAIAGDVATSEIKKLCEKWFAPIPAGEDIVRNLPVEPEQTVARSLSVNRDVPFDSIYKTYHMGRRSDPDYHVSDLISDLLSNGDSSRLFKQLVKSKKIFSDVHAYISGDIDNGLFVIEGKLMKGVSMEEAEHSIQHEIEAICSQAIEANELEKVKNKIDSTLEFSEISVLNKAMNLAFSELLGDADLINQEKEKYLAVGVEDILNIARRIFRKENCSTLYYYSN